MTEAWMRFLRDLDVSPVRSWLRRTLKVLTHSRVVEVLRVGVVATLTLKAEVVRVEDPEVGGLKVGDPRVVDPWAVGVFY